MPDVAPTRSVFLARFCRLSGVSFTGSEGLWFPNRGEVNWEYQGYPTRIVERSGSDPPLLVPTTCALPAQPLPAGDRSVRSRLTHPVEVTAPQEKLSHGRLVGRTWELEVDTVGVTI